MRLVSASRWSHFVMGLGAVLCATILLISTAMPSFAQRNTADSGAESTPTIVIGFSGVTWDELSQRETPYLWDFAQESAAANIVVRTVGETTCPAAGWLTVSAGQRAQVYSGDCHVLGGVDTDDAGGTLRVNDWDSYTDANASNKYDLTLGNLGDTLDGLSTLAIGPGAALALANSDGSLSAEYYDVPALPGSDTQSMSGGDDSGSVSAATAYAEAGSGKDVVVVDLGSVRYPDSALTDSTGDTGETTGSFADSLKAVVAAFHSESTTVPSTVMMQVHDLDSRFGALLTQIEATTPNATIVVSSVGDAQEDVAQLGFFAVSGADLVSQNGASAAGDLPALATSDATRQQGLIQITDLFPSVVSWANAGSSEVLGSAVGSPVVSGVSYSSGESLVSRLQDDNIRAKVTRPLTGPFFLLMLASAGAVAIVGFYRVREGVHSPKRRQDIENYLQICAWVAALPISSLLINLVPWWRFVYPTLGFFGGVALIAGLISWLATMPRWKDPIVAPMVTVAAVTAGVLSLDVILDQFIDSYPLHLASVLLNQPQVGARFYGFGNSTFAMFAASLLLVSAFVGNLLIERGRKKEAIAVVLAIGAFAVVVDGSAGIGADFGGPPALIVGFFVLLVMLARIRFTWLRIFLLLGGAIATSLGFAFIDYLRPPEQRSHLGRFIQTLLNGGGMNVISRKISESFFGLPWTLIALLLVVVTAVVVFLWVMYRRGAFRRKRSLPVGEESVVLAAWHNVIVLRDSVISVTAALAVGLLINDSSVVIPALGYTVAVPLWIIMTLRFGEKSYGDYRSASGVSAVGPA